MKVSSSLINKLKKCKVSQLKYTKTKKVVACVKTLQQYLNKKLGTKLTIDGWYGDSTLKAVKKFQTEYNKTKKAINVKSGDKITSNSKNLTYKLNTNGKMDKETLNAMCQG